MPEQKGKPPMNTDERGSKTRVLSALIGVHQRLELVFQQSASEHGSELPS
jgi:hypothetical protein